MSESLSAALRDLPDRALRKSLSHPANLRAFLTRVVPELADGFDYESAILLDREFPRDDWRRREADLPFQIRYRHGTEELTALVCVLIEHQSDTDTLVPLRTLYFAAGYWDRQWLAWSELAAPRPSLRLHPVLPLVLHTGPRPWGSNRKLIDLLGEPREFHRFAPLWEPLFWNLADESPQALLDSGEAWLQMMAVLRVESADAEEFRNVYAEALRRLEATEARDSPRWEELIRIILAWGQYRRPREENERLQAAAAASQSEVDHKRRVETMGQTFAEWQFEKGELRTAKRYLRKMLQQRFGQLSEGIQLKIDMSTDLEKLDRAVDEVPGLTSVDDLQL